MQQQHDQVSQTSQVSDHHHEQLESTSSPEEVVLVLDNGNEVKNNTQYYLYRWMYNKVGIHLILLFNITYNTILIVWLWFQEGSQQKV